WARGRRSPSAKPSPPPMARASSHHDSCARSRRRGPASISGSHRLPPREAAGFGAGRSSRLTIARSNVIARALTRPACAGRLGPKKKNQGQVKHMSGTFHTRRRFGALCLGAAALAATPSLAAPQLLRRISALEAVDWRDHFTTLANDAILCDLTNRVMHYWGEDGFYRIYPTAVPMSDEFARRGRTQIVLKRARPEWAPTPNMLARNP